jgi:tetratricopeptide (TPR) repeat protein
MTAVALAGALWGCTREPEADPPTVPAGALDLGLSNALATARQAVVAARESAEAWGRFGQALDAAEYGVEARACYGRAAALDPASARWPHLLGLLQLQDEPEAAFASLGRAVELAGSSNDAPRLRLAQALIERGRFAAATNHLGLLLGTNPNHPAARLELARVRFAEDRWSEAGDLLGPGLTNVYTARAATMLLSQVRAREGRSAEAVELARRAAAMPRAFDWPDPYLREVQSLRVDRARMADRVNQLLAQRRLTEAGGVVSNALQRVPDDPEALLLAGRVLLLERSCTEAEERFRSHLRVVEGSLNGLVQLSLSLLCQQRWADAARVLEQAIALKPDLAPAHANLGLARSRQGDTAGAIRSYREALRCSPGDAGAHAALADELARAGERAEALRHAEQALELEPGHPRARAVRDRLGTP